MHLAIVLAAVLVLLSVANLVVQRQQVDSLAVQRAQLLAEITALKKEAAKLNTPSTYAKAAKLQRSAAAKEKELASLRAQPTDSWHGKIGLFVRIIQMSVVGISAIWFWGKPLASLPASWVWPLDRLLAMPHTAQFAGLGLIAAGPYCYMCVRASRALAQALLSSPGST